MCVRVTSTLCVTFKARLHTRTHTKLNKTIQLISWHVGCFDKVKVQNIKLILHWQYLVLSAAGGQDGVVGQAEHTGVAGPQHLLPTEQELLH